MMNRRVRRRSFLGYAASAVAALGLAGRSSAAVLAGSVQPAAGQSPTPGSIRLSYLAGSTVKIEQLIGDFDKQLQQPTLNQTNSRYGLVGTDLGNSFEHNGKVYFLFGDNAAPGARDPMGFTQSTDPDGPLQLDFVSRAPRSFIPVGPPGVTMGPFETPLHGISLDSVPYVTVSTSHSVDRSTDKSLLTRFDEGAMSFATVREISHLPDGRFIKMTLRLASQPIPGLPGSAPYVLIFGSGEYRKSNAYLAAVPAASFTSGENTRYCAGLNGTDPAWSDREGDAVPIVVHPTIGDLSVIYVDQLGLWIMTYDSRDPRGILLRYATQPWGPWSDPVMIFNDVADHALGVFIHDPRRQPDDGVAGPVTGRGSNAAQIAGGAYAPYIVERFTRVEDNTLTLHYLVSTWNPYTVVRLRSTLLIGAAEP